MAGLNPYKIKRRIFGTICVLLLFPALQFSLNFVKEEWLGGYQQHKPEAAFSKKAWFKGEFQENYEAWYNENFGFRNSFVRLNNQLLFSLYDTSQVFDMVVGKEGYLFYGNYIRAYTGQDYMGEEYIRSATGKIKNLQDSLEKRGITLVVVLAPGPASYFPEYLPEKYGREGEKTIYKSMVREMTANSVNLLDFNAWFRQMKPTAKHPLITLSGTHWSCYGVALAADSLVRYVGKKRNIAMPSLYIRKMVLTDEPHLPDNDIYATANLWSPFVKQRVAYPEWEYRQPANKTHLRMIGAGDSYFDVMMRNTKISPACFDRIDFWSYNEIVYYSDGSPHISTENISAGDEILKNQVVVLMATEANYGGMFWNFLDEAHDYFCNRNTQLPDPVIKKNKVMIMKDKGWFLTLQRIAQEEKISVDSVLNRTARAMAEEQGKK
ncbi:MAG: sugar O-acetyltransferase [Bacteroidetes bacterium]|nr:MAG: sugar O-acetyltransferase [Bacteroidota bacterium]